MKNLFFWVVVLFFLPAVVLGATFSKNLSYGTTGTDVSQLQQFLANEGLFNGQITATFGPQTQKALISFQKQEKITPANGFFGPITRVRVESILAAHPEWTTSISNDNYYSNVDGNSVHNPVTSSNGIPAGATAECRDGTYSFSLSQRGSCSHHGGVFIWLR